MNECCEIRRHSIPKGPVVTRSVEIPDAAVQAAFDAYTSDFSISIEDAVRAALVAARPYLMPTREEMVEAISARLHITTDQIATGGHPRHLVADTSAVYEAADAVLALLSTSGESGE